MCDCKYCQRDHVFYSKLEAIHPDEREVLVKAYEDLVAIELDLAVTQAVIKGTWLSANEVIERVRKGSTGR